MTEEEQEEQEAPATAENSGDDGGGSEEAGPDAGELDQDPAYNPDDENLKDIKGG
jgi:hypothetical protein